MSACAFVAKGAGITIVDPFTALEAKGWPIAVKPFAPAINLDFVIAYPIHAQRSQLVSEFVAELRRALAANPRLKLVSRAD